MTVQGLQEEENSNCITGIFSSKSRLVRQSRKRGRRPSLEGIFPNKAWLMGLAVFWRMKPFVGAWIHSFPASTKVVSTPRALIAFDPLRASRGCPVLRSSSRSFMTSIDEVKSSTPASPTDRFHADMERVLESRRHRMEAQNQTQYTEIDRQQRPVVLNSDVDGAERVHGLLKVLCQRGLATEKSFQIVMRAYVDRGRLRWRPSDVAQQDSENESEEATKLQSRKVICAADQVEVLLQELLQRSQENPLSIDTYNLVLKAYANCATPRGERNYALRAQALLERLEAMYGDVPLESLLHVLHATAWQQSNLQPGVYAEKSKEYLDRVCERTNDASILLQAHSWTLEAFSKSGSDGSADVAESLLEKMIQINATLDSSDTAAYCLNVQDFSNAILACSKSNDSQAASRAQKLLNQMVNRFQSGAFPAGSEPPLIAFNSAIVAWSKQGDSAGAAAVLWLLDDVCRTCQSLEPDVFSFNSVLHAYLRSKAPVQKARALVQYMSHNCKKKPSIRPNSFTYYTYLKCLLEDRQRARGNYDDALEEMQDILSKLEACWLRGDFDMEPNNRIYNMIINAYAKSNEKRAWRTALYLLDRMKALAFEYPDLAALAPDIITVTSVMECLSKAADPQAPQLAQSLLTDAFHRYHETQDVNDRPNLRTYTMAILTLSKNHGSVVQARHLLDQLLALYHETGASSLQPNAYPYNYVLNCAATTTADDPAEAFQIATRTFQELRQAGLADSYTYAFWLKCCTHLVSTDDLKEKCVRYAFDECKKNGLVTSEVLSRLFQALPRKIVLEEMLEGKVVTKDENTVGLAARIDDLPKEWSRNTSRPRRSRTNTN